MEYFYMRVSTQGIRGNGVEQTFERQIGIFESHGYVLNDRNQFSDHISGSSEGDKRDGFNEMLKVLKEGDTVYFTEISRFSRNLISGLHMIDELTLEKKVNIHFVSENKTLEGGMRSNPTDWFYITQMLTMAEFQRREIGFNTSNALKAKRSNGVKLGRKTLFTDREKDEIRLDSCMMSYQELAEKYHASKSTICLIVKGKGKR